MSKYFKDNEKVKIAFGRGGSSNVNLKIRELSIETFIDNLTQCKKGIKNDLYFIRGGDLQITKGDKNLVTSEFNEFLGLDHYHRNDSSLLTACTIPIDVDYCLDENGNECNAPTPQRAADIVRSLGYKFALYTTYSHRQKKNVSNNDTPIMKVCDDNKYRIVFFTEREYKKHELRPTINALLDEIETAGINIARVPEMYMWSQCWFFGTRQNPIDCFFKKFYELHGRNVSIKEIEYTLDKKYNRSTRSQSQINDDIASGTHFNTSISFYVQAIINDDITALLAENLIISFLKVSSAKNLTHKRHNDWKKLCIDDYKEVKRQIDNAEKKRIDDSIRQPIEISDNFLFKSQDIPEHIVSKNLWIAACECARFTKTSPNMSLLVGISICAALLNKKVKILINSPHWVTYITLGMLIGAGSGARKTTISDIMGSPLFDFDKKLYGEWRGSSHKRSALKKKLEASLKSDYGKKRKKKKSETLEEVKEVAQELEEKEKELASISSTPPAIFVQDVTEAKLIQKLAESENSTLAIISDDARNIIKNLLGRQNIDGASDEGIFIAGLTGGNYFQDRIGTNNQGKDVRLYDISLNVSLMVQLDKVRDVIKNPIYLESGLCARIPIYISSVDGSKLMENINIDNIDDDKMQPYLSALEKLCILVDKKDTANMILSDDALLYLQKFSNKISNKIKSGGEWSFSGAYDQVNKITTTACIYAVVFKTLDEQCVLDPANHVITEKNLKLGCDFAEFIIAQSLHVTNNFEQKYDNSGSKTVLKRILSDYSDGLDYMLIGFKCNYKFKVRQSDRLRNFMQSILNNLVRLNWLIEKNDFYFLNIKGIEKGVVQYSA